MKKQEDNLSLGERIKLSIKDRKLNLSAIARDLNMSPQAMDQIDRKKNFSLEFLESLKKATDGIIDFTKNATHYENINTTEKLEEPTISYGKADVELSFNISVKTTKESISKLGALMEAFNLSAKNLGFTINY